MRKQYLQNSHRQYLLNSHRQKQLTQALRQLRSKDRSPKHTKGVMWERESFFTRVQEEVYRWQMYYPKAKSMHF